MVETAFVSSSSTRNAKICYSVFISFFSILGMSWMFIQREESMKTILLADDEANLRTLIRMTLEDPHYRILEATDGTAALQLA